MAPVHPRPGRVLLPALVLALALPSLACSWRRTAWELGLGSFATDLTVARVAGRGPYREATLVGHGLTLEVLAPDTATCRHVLAAEASVDYVERGVGGHYERDGSTCVAAGGGLRLVGSRQPRATTLAEEPVPRSQATFAVLHADDEVMLLRGRFPEAWRVGWPGGDDTVVMVPNVPVCRSAIGGGVASMEYRAGDRVPLALVGADGLCPIQALARPLETGSAPPG